MDEFEDETEIKSVLIASCNDYSDFSKGNRAIKHSTLPETLKNQTPKMAKNNLDDVPSSRTWNQEISDGDIDYIDESALLPIIHYKSKFKRPIFLDPEAKSSLSMQELIKKTVEYHNSLHNELRQFQTTYGVHPGWCEPIKGSSFPPILQNNSHKDLSDDDNFENSSLSPVEKPTYISRSGRHVKMIQTYSEDSEMFDIENDVTSSTAIPPPQPAKRNNSSSKWLNEEIMERSALFRDSPVRKRPAARSVSDDNMPLQVISSFGGGGNNQKNTGANVPKEELESPNYNKVRVVPPLRGKKQTFAPLSAVEIPSTSASQEPEDNSNCFSPKGLATKRGLKRKNVDCPICSIPYPIKEIEEHASTCGVTAALQIENNFPDQTDPINIQTCNICDKTFPLTTQFEVHVNECKRKHM